MLKPYKIPEYINISCIYSMFENRYEKGFVFPGETHNFWECVIVTGGEAVITGDECIYRLTKGNIIFHQPMEMHKIEVEKDCGTNLFIFSFSMDGEGTEFFKKKVFMLNGVQTDTVSSFLGYIRSKIAPPYTGFNKHTENLNNSLFLQTVSTYITQLFLSLSENGCISAPHPDTDAPLFSKAVNYMKENLYTSPTVGEIARSCSVSETGLKRVFAKHAGFGVHKYLLKLKIGEAVRLLSEGLSVTETADRLGFSSQGYFSYVFKRETGINPSENKLRNSHYIT